MTSNSNDKNITSHLLNHMWEIQNCISWPKVSPWKKHFLSTHKNTLKLCHTKSTENYKKTQSWDVEVQNHLTFIYLTEPVKASRRPQRLHHVARMPLEANKTHPIRTRSFKTWEMNRTKPRTPFTSVVCTSNFFSNKLVVFSSLLM